MQRIDTKIQEKITIKGKDVADVDDFTYLESKVYRERAGMKNLRNRLWQARGAVMHRRKRIRSANNLSRKSKLRMSESFVSMSQIDVHWRYALSRLSLSISEFVILIFEHGFFISLVIVPFSKDIHKLQRTRNCAVLRTLEYVPYGRVMDQTRKEAINKCSLVPRRSLLPRCPREVWGRAGESSRRLSLGDVTAHGILQDWPNRERLGTRLQQM